METKFVPIDYTVYTCTVNFLKGTKKNVGIINLKGLRKHE